MQYIQYPDLRSVLLFVEKQNELFLNNHGQQHTKIFFVQSHAT